MDSRNTDIIDPHITSMASSHLNLGLFLRSNNYNGRHYLYILFYLLQNHIRSLRLFQLNKIMEFVIIENSPGELLGANLTLHSSPKVGSNRVVILGNYFILKPFL